MSQHAGDDTRMEKEIRIWLYTTQLHHIKGWVWKKDETRR
jgi:hypothetical protein